MSVKMQLVHVFIILASCWVCGGHVLVGGSVTADVGDPKVIRSAHFGTFGIQQSSGYYVSLKSVDDAEIQIVAGQLYDLKITLNVSAGCKDHDEKCEVHVLEQVWLKPYNILSYYNCDGILGREVTGGSEGDEVEAPFYRLFCYKCGGVLGQHKIFWTLNSTMLNEQSTATPVVERIYNGIYRG